MSGVNPVGVICISCERETKVFETGVLIVELRQDGSEHRAYTADSRICHGCGTVVAPQSSTGCPAYNKDTIHEMKLRHRKIVYIK